MRITKGQLRRIIKEEWEKNYKSITFPERTADTAVLARELETVYYNLDDMLSGLADDGLIDEITMNKELLASVIYRLGGKRLG